MLISIAIFAIVIAVMVNSKISQQGQTVSQQQAVEMQQTVRAVIYLMAKELRTAGYNPHLKDYKPGITSAGLNTITFTAVASEQALAARVSEALTGTLGSSDDPFSRVYMGRVGFGATPTSRSIRAPLQRVPTRHR